jgi:hypothetical protein
MVSELDDALDELSGPGTISVDRDGHRAEVDVVDADRLGVSIRRLRVERERPVDVVDEAHALPERLRSLPERVRAVEIDPHLGGSVLRTEPDDLRDDEFFEVQVRPDHTEVRRTRVTDDGDRQGADFTLTRQQLDRLIDEAAGPRS